MSNFLDALRSGRVLLMDGAMGTELQRVGLKLDENAAAWNILQPKRVRAVHQAYKDAGAEVMLTNTFMHNSHSLAATLHQSDLSKVTAWPEAMALCEFEGCYRVAAVGPVAGADSKKEFADLGEFWVPGICCTYNPEPRYHEPDAALLETCSTPRVRYPIWRLVRRDHRPVLLSLSFLHNDAGELVTFSGHAPEWFAERAKQYGLSALGINCGRDISIADCAEIIRRYRQVTDLPLFARPNAGTPKNVRGRWIYPLTPREMADQLPELLEAGVSMVGGCCGTTPEHIAALSPVLKRWNASRNRVPS